MPVEPEYAYTIARNSPGYSVLVYDVSGLKPVEVTTEDIRPIALATIERKLQEKVGI